MSPLLTRLLVVLSVVAASLLVPVRMAWSAPETRLATVQDADRPAGRPVPFPATHLGLRWTGDHDAGVQVRWQRDGRWAGWQDVEVAHDLEDKRRELVYSGVLRAEGAERVETRVLAGTAADIEVTAIDTENGPRHLVRAGSPPAGAQAAPDAGRAPQPTVVTRAQWGADESMRQGEPPTFATITKLIVHHTVTTNDDPDPASSIRAMYAFHTRVRGWNDIAYNFLVDANGRVYEGRFARTYGAGEVPTGQNPDGKGVVGAHAEGANTGSVGVALLGDFTDRSPSPEARTSLQALLAWSADRAGIDPLASSLFVRAGGGGTVTLPNIAGHRDASATACPGDLLYAALPGLRQAVASSVAAARLVTPGYWVASRDGAVRPFGEAAPLGDTSAMALTSPVRAVTPTPRGRGYWVLTADGRMFSFGDAEYFGSTSTLRLTEPVVGMAATPTGRGSWVLARDGGIFSFGDARFFGSTGALKLNQPVVGMASTPTGQGYWLVAADGGIFAFGDAVFRGSTGALKLNQPVVGMAAAPGGQGYWLAARDGGMFAFNVPFAGSIPGLRLRSYGGTVSMKSTPTGRGYYVLGGDGGIFAFGDARFHGALPGLSGNAAAVDLGLVAPS